MKYLILTCFLAASFLGFAQNLTVSPAPVSGTGIPTNPFIKVEKSKGSYLVQFLDKDLKILHTTRSIKHM